MKIGLPELRILSRECTVFLQVTFQQSAKALVSKHPLMGVGGCWLGGSRLIAGRPWHGRMDGIASPGEKGSKRTPSSKDVQEDELDGPAGPGRGSACCPPTTVETRGKNALKSRRIKKHQKYIKTNKDR